MKAVIIGGGIVGILMASEMLGAGWDVILLDAGPGPGQGGSTARSAAAIRQQWSDPNTVLAMRYCVDFYRKFSERFAIGGQRADQPYHARGYLYPYWELPRWMPERDVDAKKAAALFQLHRDLGVQGIEHITDVSELLKRFPFLKEQGLLGARFCSTDGFLRPEVICGDVHTYCRAVFGDRYQPHFNTEVKLIARHAGLVQAVRSQNNQAFRGDVYINCTNAFTWMLDGKFAKGIHDPVHIVEAYRRYLWVLDVKDCDKRFLDTKRMPMTVLPSGVYVRPEYSGHQLMVGYAHKTSGEAAIFDRQDYVNDMEAGDLFNGVFGVYQTLDSQIRQIFNCGYVTTTAGYYGVTPDHSPIIDRRFLDNWYCAVGFSGHGVMMAPFAARMMRSIILSGTSAHGQLYLPEIGRSVNMAPYAHDRDYTKGKETEVI